MSVLPSRGVPRAHGVAAAATRNVASWERLAGAARAWLGRLLILLVRGYQLLLSPLLPPSCRFYPSCSEYAAQAIRLHGPLRGVWLAAARLGRCHPFHAGGVDPVPPAAEGARPNHHPVI